MNHAGETSPDGFPVEAMQLTGIGGEGKGWEVTPPTRSLAIVGSHPATRTLAPYDDPDFEIWLFNEAAMKPSTYKRWDGLLQIHLPEVYTSTDNWVNKGHWEWLQQDHGPDKRIFMQDVDPRVPNSVKYPLEEVLSLVPYKYLRSSPAMALALAIYLGYRRIDLYGSELSSNTEYGYQAINYAFWIGFAHGYGVDLRLECWQTEFNQPVYGYEGEFQIPKSVYEDRVKDLEVVERLNREAMAKVEDRMKEAMIDHDFQKVADLSINLEELAKAAGEANGALGEAKRYLERENPISRQEYERVSANAQTNGEKAKADMHHEAGKAEYAWNVWRQTGKYMALNQLRTFLKQKTDFAFEMGRQLGIFRENVQYMSEYDTGVTAAGGMRALRQAGTVKV